jgi:hypothetical protein
MEETRCECGANVSCKCEPKEEQYTDGLEMGQIPVKDLEYWRLNAEEDYINTPISVLRYIGELEKRYSEENLKEAFFDGWELRNGELPFPKAKNKWFEQFKNK